MIKNRRYFKTHDTCLRDCIANLFNCPQKEVPNIYKIKHRESGLLKRCKKKGVKYIEISEPLHLILPQGYHIRVGDAVSSDCLNDRVYGGHACIYYNNRLVYDPCGPNGDGILPNTYKYYIFFDGLKVRNDEN